MGICLAQDSCCRGYVFRRKGGTVALFGHTPADMNGFSCSLTPLNGQVLHKLIWPEKESPVVYSDRDQYSEAFYSKLLLSPGETFTTAAYLVIKQYEQPRVAWSKMLEVAWQLNAHNIKTNVSLSDIWDHSINYARKGLWKEDGAFKGFTIGTHWSDGEWTQVRHYEIGWCGQNASLANSFLADYLRTGNLTSKEQGLAVLDVWVKNGRLPNGLIHCHYDYLLFKSSPSAGVQSLWQSGFGGFQTGSFSFTPSNFSHFSSLYTTVLRWMNNCFDVSTSWHWVS